jgi:ribonuclease HII
MEQKHILLKGSYNEDTNIVEVGVDEAGRGALAGPVTVAACIMPHGFNHPLIKDSKLLNEAQRK